MKEENFTHSFNTELIDLDSLTVSNRSKHFNNFLDSLIREKMLYEKLIDLIEDQGYKKIVTLSFYSRDCKPNKITNTLLLEYVRVNYDKNDKLKNALKFFILKQIKDNKDLLNETYDINLGKKLKYYFEFNDKQGSEITIYFYDKTQVRWSSMDTTKNIYTDNTKRF